ncbi:MAG TPA: GNAT family N-acetyltransferase, partial [Myxococcota bacterium]|nr:GNAT family N-acetyltransferase [Myxococcota bacterium]
MEALEARSWLVLPAMPEETPALAELGVDSLARGWSAAALAAALARSDGWAWTLRARPGAAPLGFLLGRRALDELHVLLMAVAPAWRRRGAGAALLETALAAARAACLTAVHLEVRAGNAPALAFYARHGFLAVGR